MNGSGKQGLPIPGLQWRGFTLQIFLIIVLPLTALLVAIAFGSQSLHHDAMRAMVGDRDLRAVRTAANSLNEELAHRADLIHILAAQETPGLPPETGWRAAFPGGLALISDQGNIVETSGGSILAGLSTERLSEILAGGGEGFSEPFVGEEAAQQVWVLAGARRANGSLLVGAFAPADLANQAVRGAVDLEHTSLALAAPGDMILYRGGPELASGHSGLESALNAESGIDYHHSADGEHVVAFSPVAPLGWGLVLEESWESIASPALNTTQWAPLILAPVLLFALLALWFGARQVIQPLQALQASTSELARGNFRAVEEPVGGITEIQLLQKDLAEMARGLESAQESLRGYIGAITEGIENERRGLARELHDDTLQTLIALQQRIQLASRGAGGAGGSLEEVHAQVAQTITNLRRLVRGLRPIYLEDLGLPAALEMLAKENAQAAGMDVTFKMEGTERRLPPESELALYRITQEALSNTVRHAQASRAQVEIDYQPERVVLSVEDDGKGFQPPSSPADFAARGHFGLVGMAERAELIGARLAIESAPGRGARLRVEVPGGPDGANAASR